MKVFLTMLLALMLSTCAVAAKAQSQHCCDDENCPAEMCADFGCPAACPIAVAPVAPPVVSTQPWEVAPEPVPHLPIVVQEVWTPPD